MRDLQSKTLLWLKACLFIFLGGTASGLLLWLVPRRDVALLLVLSVWAFCRAYYFAFYVLEKYVDPNFRYSGLGALLLYLWKKRK